MRNYVRHFQSISGMISVSGSSLQIISQNVLSSLHFYLNGSIVTSQLYLMETEKRCGEIGTTAEIASYGHIFANFTDNVVVSSNSSDPGLSGKLEESHNQFPVSTSCNAFALESVHKMLQWGYCLIN